MKAEYILEKDDITISIIFKFGLVISLSFATDFPFLWWTDDTNGYRQFDIVSVKYVDLEHGKAIAIMLIPFFFRIVWS